MLKNKKIYIWKNWKEIQEKAIKLWWVWSYSWTKTIVDLNECYLFFGADNRMTHGINPKDSYGDITYNELMQMPVIESELPKNKFKPFDKVLAKSDLDDVWKPAFFAMYHEEWYHYYPYEMVWCKLYSFCIPYFGNEHLLWKTDNPF